MTETSFGTPFTSPRLERPADTPFLGVATALARTTGTDVVLWRVLFVVLTFFGGLGAALYLACYVSIPSEGDEHSLASRVLHGPDRRVTTRQVLLLALVVVATVGALHDNGGWLVAVLAVALAYSWWRRRHPARESSPPSFAAATVVTTAAAGAPADVPADAPAASPADAPAASAKASRGRTGTDAGPAAVAQPVIPPAQPGAPAVWSPPAPKPLSVLTPLTLSTAALAVGVLLLVAAAGTSSIPTEVVLATALGVVGLGLVVSAMWGRARGLVPVAVLLALALGGTVVARPAIDHGVGERDWVARSAGTFRLGMGDATLTVASPVGAAGTTQDVTARVSYGHLKVIVPPGIRTVVDVRVQTGDVQADGGVDDSGRGVHRTFAFGPPGPPQVHVDARVGTGMVEVRRG